MTEEECINGWQKEDDIFIVQWWGSRYHSHDCWGDSLQTEVVYCDRPEEAIRAIRELHDEFAVFKSLIAKSPISRRPS